jgi:hypothetical protein
MEFSWGSGMGGRTLCRLSPASPPSAAAVLTYLTYLPARVRLLQSMPPHTRRAVRTLQPCNQSKDLVSLFALFHGSVAKV